MDNSLVQAYEEQSKYVKKLEVELEKYKQYAAVRQSKGRTKVQRQKSKRFVKVYKESNCILRQSKVLTQAEKILLFDVLPYTDYETNVIVDEQKIPMNIKNITKLCGLGKTTVLTALNHLETKGIIQKVKQGRETFVKLNEEYFGLC